MAMLKRALFATLVTLLSSVLIFPQGRSADAPHPVFDVDGACLLGGTLKGKWLRTEAIVPLLKGGERYRLYTSTRAAGEATGTQPQSWGTPCDDSYDLKLSPPVENNQSLLAISGDWNALPRVPKLLSTSDPAYRKVVADLLRSKGITRPEVKIDSIMRVDLEGDGVDEVLLGATRYVGGLSPQVHAGDYSLILLRKVVRGRVRNILIEEEHYLGNKRLEPPNEYKLMGAFDVNGDGAMEIVVRSDYYEGGQTLVFRLNGNRVGAALYCGCGA